MIFYDVLEHKFYACRTWTKSWVESEASNVKQYFHYSAFFERVPGLTVTTVCWVLWAIMCLNT